MPLSISDKYSPMEIAAGLAAATKAEEKEVFVANKDTYDKLAMVRKIITDITSPTGAKISQEVHKPFNDCGSVSVKGKVIDVTDPAAFFEACALANNAEVTPHTNGKLELDFSFTGLKSVVE